MKLLERIKKNIGITKKFLTRKKRGKFNFVQFIRFAFQHYGNHSEVEYKYKRYRKVTE